MDLEFRAFQVYLEPQLLPQDQGYLWDQCHLLHRVTLVHLAAQPGLVDPVDQCHLYHLVSLYFLVYLGVQGVPITKQQ